jgi:hypothetical protein
MPTTRPPPSDLPRQPPSSKKARTTTATPDDDPMLAAPTPKLLIRRLTQEATLPTRGSPFAAGLDLYSSVPPSRSLSLAISQRN